jgi:hypothetical protein
MPNKKRCELCGGKTDKLYLIGIDNKDYQYWCRNCKKEESKYGDVDCFGINPGGKGKVSFPLRPSFKPQDPIGKW